MTRIAFVGLGVMGLPMARNIATANPDVQVYTASAASRQRAASHGLNVAETLLAACDMADIIITMLPDTPDVASVAEECLTQGRPRTLFIDMSTIDPGATRALGSLFEQAGLAYLDAPVSGGEAAAVEGTLSIMVGGPKDAFERAQPVFAAMGSTIVHVGDTGAGQVVKAANQLIVAGNIQMLAEALVFLRAHDVDLPTALRVLQGGLAGSTVLTRKQTAMLTENYAPGFRLSLHSKDLGIVQAAMKNAGLALPLTALVTQLVQSLVARGDGGFDHSALQKLAMELNGQR